MNAIEIRGLKKSFRGLYALDGLDMTVPVGAIYGFIGENGSGKSTTEKLICGHLVPSGGKIKLFGKSYRDAGVRVRVRIGQVGLYVQNGRIVRQIRAPDVQNGAVGRIRFDTLQ